MATKRQFISAARGTVNSSSGWDGLTMNEVYQTLLKNTSRAAATDLARAIWQNRIHAMTVDAGLHLSKDQAFAWLVESGVEAGEASCRVWGEETEEVAAAIQTAKNLHWSWLNQQHRQALEDARMAG